MPVADMFAFLASNAATVDVRQCRSSDGHAVSRLANLESAARTQEPYELDGIVGVGGGAAVRPQCKPGVQLASAISQAITSASIIVIDAAARSSGDQDGSGGRGIIAAGLFRCLAGNISIARGAAVALPHFPAGFVSLLDTALHRGALCRRASCSRRSASAI